MPSFRASLGILDVRPGVAPEVVLETARQTMATVRVVEDAHLDVEPLLHGDGVPRVVVRFLEPTGNDTEEDARAWQAALTMADGVQQVAETVGLRVYRRAGRRWLPVGA